MHPCVEPMLSASLGRSAHAVASRRPPANRRAVVNKPDRQRLVLKRHPPIGNGTSTTSEAHSHAGRRSPRCWSVQPATAADQSICVELIGIGPAWQGALRAFPASRALPRIHPACQEDASRGGLSQQLFGALSSRSISPPASKISSDWTVTARTGRSSSHTAAPAAAAPACG